jgi:hypothetical protein
MDSMVGCTYNEYLSRFALLSSESDKLELIQCIGILPLSYSLLYHIHMSPILTSILSGLRTIVYREILIKQMQMQIHIIPYHIKLIHDSESTGNSNNSFILIVIT